MRGKVHRVEGHGGLQGITPAFAGKSCTSLRSPAAGRDHPRVCGEKVALLVQHHADIGSPPRLRGKVRWGLALEYGYRITPAFAGKSLRISVMVAVNRDHPRVCGEKRVWLLLRRVFQGSPPRLRGKGLHRGTEGALHGITPAFAGKRQPHRREHGRNRDHPRVCGEKRPSLPKNPPLLGSPPRMRGKE